jgi:hypothetical protein
MGDTIQLRRRLASTRARGSVGSSSTSGATARTVGMASTSTSASARSKAAMNVGRTLWALAYTPPWYVRRDSSATRWFTLVRAGSRSAWRRHMASTEVITDAG